MAGTEVHLEKDVSVGDFNRTLGTPTSSRINIHVPVRGRVIEAGFVPNSLCASAITLSVLTDDHVSSTASNFVEIITSTLGTFSSTNLYEGATCSVIPPSAAWVEDGGAIRCVTSGGNTSAIGGYVYAIIRKG